MKVSRLIELLKDLDQDATITLLVDAECIPIKGIEDLKVAVELLAGLGYQPETAKDGLGFVIYGDQAE